VVRRQVQFTEQELAAVQTLARERSSSFAAIVRGAVDAYLHDMPRSNSATCAADRIDTFAGKYRSGRDDISRRHDDYLADSIPEGLDAE